MDYFNKMKTYKLNFTIFQWKQCFLPWYNGWRRDVDDHTWGCLQAHSSTESNRDLQTRHKTYRPSSKVESRRRTKVSDVWNLIMDRVGQDVQPGAVKREVVTAWRARTGQWCVGSSAARWAHDIIVIMGVSWMRLAQECEAWHKQRESYISSRWSVIKIDESSQSYWLIIKSLISDIINVRKDFSACWKRTLSRRWVFGVSGSSRVTACLRSMAHWLFCSTAGEWRHAAPCTRAERNAPQLNVLILTTPSYIYPMQTVVHPNVKVRFQYVAVTL